MPAQANASGVAKAKDVLKKKGSYIKFAASRQKDADISKLPVPARGKQLGAEWSLAKKELGMPVVARKPAKKPATKKKTVKN